MLIEVSVLKTVCLSDNLVSASNGERMLSKFVAFCNLFVHNSLSPSNKLHFAILAVMGFTTATIMPGRPILARTNLNAGNAAHLYPAPLMPFLGCLFRLSWLIIWRMGGKTSTQRLRPVSRLIISRGESGAGDFNLTLGE